MSGAADLRSRRKATGCSQLQCSGLNAKPGTPTMAGLVITTWRRCQRRGSGNPATPGTWAEATISGGRYLSPSIHTTSALAFYPDRYYCLPSQRRSGCPRPVLSMDHLLQVATYNAILTLPTTLYTKREIQVFLNIEHQLGTY